MFCTFVQPTIFIACPIAEHPAPASPSRCKLHHAYCARVQYHFPRAQSGFHFGVAQPWPSRFPISVWFRTFASDLFACQDDKHDVREEGYDNVNGLRCELRRKGGLGCGHGRSQQMRVTAIDATTRAPALSPSPMPSLSVCLGGKRLTRTHPIGHGRHLFWSILTGR